MPSVIENRRRWAQHGWDHAGDEWSPGGTPEGTAILWWRTLRPRLHAWVPADTIVEIGPGFGRWTQYLRELCTRLIVVDLTSRCIEHCRQRFAGDDRIDYVLNDGMSLGGIADGSVDLVFSFDSLVHVEHEVLAAYLAEIARALRPGGAAFLHHSNLGALVSPWTGRLPRYVRRRNWRAESVSARTVRDASREVGLLCRSQEIINWIGRGAHADRFQLKGERMPLTDCLSVIVKPREASGLHAGPSLQSTTRIVLNHHFVDEWREARMIVATYAQDADTAPGPALPAHVGLLRKKLATIQVLRRRGGVRAVARVAVMRIGETFGVAWAAVQDWCSGEMVRLAGRVRRPM